MFFVSFHGGKPTKSIPDPINNVCAYDDNGNQLSSAVLDPGRKEKLDELRGLYLVAGGAGLFVINGSKDTSNILYFTGSDTSYGSPTEFASASTTSAINHPFAMAFDGNGNWFVSNQDTNVVATLLAQSGQSPAKAASLGSYLDALYPTGTFLNGTLIASAVTGLPNVQSTTKVPKELGGLDAEIESGKTQHSVRDVQFYTFTFNQQTLALLFIVDEANQMVRVYDPSTGQPLRCSNQLPASPTHLLINQSQNTLYLGVGNQVFSSPIPNPYDPSAPAWVFAPIAALSNLSGDVADMAFDSGGNFHVAIRTKNTVIKYNSSFGNPVPWSATMSDNPEFLLYIPD
jgi:hypothetical protein